MKQRFLVLLPLILALATLPRLTSVNHLQNAPRTIWATNSKHQVRRLTHKERVQRRMERRRERADFSETTGALPDPRQIMDKLRYMAEGHVLYADGAAQHVIEDYLDAGGRSPTLAFELALRACAQKGDENEINSLLDLAEHAGMDRTQMLDSLLQDFSKIGQEKVAESLYEGMSPNPRRFGYLLQSAIKSKDIAGAWSWIKEHDKAGFTIEPGHFNSFIRLCVRKEGVARTERRFQELLELRFCPDDTSFGMLMDAYSKKGNVTACLRWLDKMEAFGLTPGSMHYGQILKACAKSPGKHSFEAERVVRSMRSHQISLTQVDRWHLLEAVGPERFKKACKSMGLCTKLPKLKSGLSQRPQRRKTGARSSN
mmetsp:Transcript_7393/g.17531  ORF Transcript_7393/g.17531 Transcript_7393/m.17531 type:complete len:370 (+) Transcript_7393:57-1166(+)